MSEILDTNHNYVLTTELHEEDIDVLKKKVENLEKSLFKSQTQIKKLENQLKKSQDLISQNGKNNNNTSISFFLPSEFKDQWEKLLKDLLLEAYENLWFHPQWLAHVIQDTISIVYQETLKTIKELIYKLLQILNIPVNETCFERFMPKFRNLFQDNFNLIFTLTNEIYETIINSIKNQADKYVNFELKNELQNDIDNKVFKNLIEAEFKLCIYMILHDPILTFNIETYEKRELNYFFYNKLEHIIVEGFGKNDPSLVILNPPLLKNKFAYQGIKPAVYIISNPNQIIQDICNKNQASLEAAKGLKSNKNSYDKITDGVDKSITGNSNKDTFEVKEQMYIQDDNKKNKEDSETLENNVKKVKFKESGMSNEGKNTNLEREQFTNQILDKGYKESNNKLTIDRNTISLVLGKLVSEDKAKNKLLYKSSLKPTNNSPVITTFSNDILSVSSILDIDEHDMKITESNNIICYDQPLQKEELRSYRSSSLKKINKYILENKKTQVTVRKKQNNNSARTNDDINLYYQTTLNNDKIENNITVNSFILRSKGIETKSVSHVTPKNDRINHKRMKSSNTGSFSSNNYILSEDNSNLHIVHNKNNSVSKKNIIYESCEKRDMLDLYKNEEINNLKRMFSSGGYRLKLENANNKKNFQSSIMVNSPKPVLASKNKFKNNNNLEFKNRVNDKLAKVKFNGNLCLNEQTLLFSPIKQNTPFTPKRNNYVKKDTISMKKDILTSQLTRNNESKENIKKPSNNKQVKQYIDNFDKIKDLTREYNYIAFNDAQLKYENKSNNISYNNLYKRSSKKLPSKNLSSELSKFSKKSKTIFKE